MLEVFTRDFEKLLFGISPLCALQRNLLKLFIKKKIANELPKEIQCMLPEDAKKHHFLGMKIWYLISDFYLTPFFIWGSDMSFEGVTCPYKPYPFINLMHKNNHHLHFPKCMFKGKLLKLQCWQTPCSFKTVPFAYPLIDLTEHCRKLCVNDCF